MLLLDVTLALVLGNFLMVYAHIRDIIHVSCSAFLSTWHDPRILQYHLKWRFPKVNGKIQWDDFASEIFLYSNNAY